MNQLPSPARLARKVCNFFGTRRRGLLAWALFCLSVKKAKTSGPAQALANNANAQNGKRRFHGALYGLPLPSASSPAYPLAFRSVTAKQHQRQIADTRRFYEMLQ
jgi:hypothetical protein